VPPARLQKKWLSPCCRPARSSHVQEGESGLLRSSRKMRRGPRGGCTCRAPGETNAPMTATRSRLMGVALASSPRAWQRLSLGNALLALLQQALVPLGPQLGELCRVFLCLPIDTGDQPTPGRELLLWEGPCRRFALSRRVSTVDVVMKQLCDQRPSVSGKEEYSLIVRDPAACPASCYDRRFLADRTGQHPRRHRLFVTSDEGRMRYLG
jgi:hypothetical protein